MEAGTPIKFTKTKLVSGPYSVTFTAEHLKKENRKIEDWRLKITWTEQEI